jgi:quinol-cytochrome oxidoreductase complex cytochrome b subunit
MTPIRWRYSGFSSVVLLALLIFAGRVRLKIPEALSHPGPLQDPVLIKPSWKWTRAYRITPSTVRRICRR